MKRFEAVARALLSNGRGGSERLLARLRELYASAVQRHRWLVEHAELAPHEAGRRALQELAAEEKEQAERLRRLVSAVGGFAGDVPVPPPPQGACNYWGRLTQDLEAHRAAARDIRDQATTLVDEHPELAEALAALAREEEEHAARLRALIARSDPQALD